MGGIELQDGELIVDRSPNALDELAIEFSSLLSDCDVDHVFIAGYVAILTGRPRATDEFDRESLENSIDAQIGGETIPIGPLELQIAYKLYLGGQKDLEDAAHLYALFGETLRRDALEEWVSELDVTDRYERLREI